MRKTWLSFPFTSVMQILGEMQTKLNGKELQYH